MESLNYYRKVEIITISHNTSVIISRALRILYLRNVNVSISSNIVRIVPCLYIRKTTNIYSVA